MVKHLPIPRMSRSDITRFWSKVDKASPDDCWLWSAGNARGYGHFWLNGKHFKATRISYSLFWHTDPGHLQVCHTCDNPRCVNPDHLWLGSSSDNNLDKTVKGRQARGDHHGSAVLSKDDVIAIKTSEKTTVVLARKYGVGNSVIGRIQRGLSWPHILPELTRASRRPGLVPSDVNVIRTSPESGAQLAKRFGVSQSTISLIKNRKLWKHV